jgi:hypothetical protein
MDELLFEYGVQSDRSLDLWNCGERLAAEIFGEAEGPQGESVVWTELKSGVNLGFESVMVARPDVTRLPARRTLPSRTERTPSSRATVRMSTGFPL